MRLEGGWVDVEGEVAFYGFVVRDDDPGGVACRGGYECVWCAVVVEVHFCFFFFGFYKGISILRKIF